MDTQKNQIMIELEIENIQLKNEITQLKQILRQSIIKSGSLENDALEQKNNSTLVKGPKRMSASIILPHLSKEQIAFVRHSNSVILSNNDIKKLDLSETLRIPSIDFGLEPSNNFDEESPSFRPQRSTIQFQSILGDHNILQRSEASKEFPTCTIKRNKTTVTLDNADPIKIKKLNNVLVTPITPTVISSLNSLPDPQLESLIDPSEKLNWVDSIVEKGKISKRTTTVYFSKLPKKIGNAPVIDSGSHPDKTHLFENFFIAGLDKNDLNQLKKTRKSFEGINPKYLYSFPMKLDQLDDESKIILDFFFPNGIKIINDTTDSSKNFGEVLYWCPIQTMHKDCFVFIVKSNMSFDPNIKVDPLFQASNPLRVKYCICVRSKDYIMTSDRKYFWITEKVYCFVTYYPLMPLFFDILYQMMDFIKRKRVLKIAEFAEDSKKFDDLDSRYTSTILTEAIEDGLKYYYNIIINPNLDDLLTIQLFRKAFDDGDIIKYKIPNKNLAHALESIWALPYVFSHLSLNDILFLYTATLMEAKLIILSQDSLLLTGTLFTLLNLIKPLEYTGQLIFILPESLIDYIEVPGFYLYGINNRREYLFTQKIFERFDIEECLFVCLDEHIIYGQENQLAELSFPLFQDFQLSLEPYYFKINKETKYTLKPIPIKKNSKATVPQNITNTKEISYPDNKKLLEPCYNILEIFSKFLAERIINYLPEEAPYENLVNREMDFKAIYEHIIDRNPYQDDKNLIGKLKKSQTLMYYIQQHYDKIQSVKK